MARSVKRFGLSFCPFSFAAFVMHQSNRKSIGNQQNPELFTTPHAFGMANLTADTSMIHRMKGIAVNAAAGKANKKIPLDLRGEQNCALFHPHNPLTETVEAVFQHPSSHQTISIYNDLK